MVLLKNGEYINGKILKENSKTIVIELPGGNKRYLSRNKIRKVVYMTLDEKQRHKERIASKSPQQIREETRRKRKIENLKKQQDQINKELKNLGVKTPSGEQPKEEKSFFTNLFGSESGNPDESENIDQNTNTYNPDSNNSESDETYEKQTKSSNWPFIWRSALVPGWGQYNKGHSTKAGAFFIGSLATIGLLYTTNQAFLTAQSNYNTNADLSLLSFGSNSAPLLAFNYLQEEELYNARNSAGVNRFNASLLLIAFYTWNILDAWIFDTDSDAGNQMSLTEKTPFFSFSILPDVALTSKDFGKRYDARFTLYF